MAEYIKREYAVDAVLDVYYDTPDIDLSGGKFEAAILKIQAADVAPVRHGMWETIDASTWRWSNDGAKPVHRVKYRHNECGRVVQRKEPYCPNCGAIMDLEG